MSDKPRKFACLMINMPRRIAADLQAFQKEIDPADLFVAEAKNGLEDHCHITLKWGLGDCCENLLAAAMAGVDPFSIQVGPITAFTTSPEHDVLKFDIVDADALHRLHEAIKLVYPNVETHPQFRPHMTIAYLNQGASARYVGAPNELTGRVVIVKHVLFSDTLSRKRLIPLKGVQ
jgi:2'-5' RNA ligase